jgi:hypothetical protein
MTDKGFREWFAKTAIVYTKQKTDAIVQDQIDRRIREETDIVHNWTKRWIIENLFGIGWACVYAIHKGLVVGFFLTGILAAIFIAMIAFVFFSIILCYPNPFRYPDTCTSEQWIHNGTLIISSETLDKTLSMVETRLSAIRYIIGENYLNKICS